MSSSVVQESVGNGISSASVTSVTSTAFNSDATPGNLIEVCLQWNSGSGTLPLTLPTQLVPRIIEKITDPKVRADFLACIGGSKTVATEEG